MLWNLFDVSPSLPAHVQTNTLFYFPPDVSSVPSGRLHEQIKNLQDIFLFISISCRESIYIFQPIYPYCIIKLYSVGDDGSWTGESAPPAKEKLVWVGYVAETKFMSDQRLRKSKPWIHTKHLLSDHISVCISQKGLPPQFPKHNVVFRTSMVAMVQ